MSAALDEATAKMRDAAGSVVDLMIETRAKRYRNNPCLLDKHFPAMDLRWAAPKAFLARIDALIEQRDRGQLPRWYGFGGESVDISMRAARLYGEWMLAEQTEDAA